ncbi:hypothetical protein [Streptomyces sp. NPDC001435]|uniref:hypothetical protein n=1 Tax=unclassified Streptomyces TaxID=2593676 RepID=UPI003683E529
MQHRRPRLSTKAKTLVAASVAPAAAAGVTVAAGWASKTCAACAMLGKYYVTSRP